MKLVFSPVFSGSLASLKDGTTTFSVKTFQWGMGETGEGGQGKTPSYKCWGSNI